MRLTLAFIAFAVSGCEAQTRVVTAIEFPASIPPAARTRAQLHVALTSTTDFSETLVPPRGKCPTFDASAEAYDGSFAITSRGFEMEQHKIPTVHDFCAAGWFDTNANGQIDAGDAVGKLDVPYPHQPSKFFSSNRYRSPPIVLELVP